MILLKNSVKIGRRAFGTGAVLSTIATPALPGTANTTPSADTPTTRTFAMTIEDTILTLVDKQTYHAFSFNGQTPGPLFHVREGDLVEVAVENQTTLPHTIHWHGLLQKNNWQFDGVPDATQLAIAPGETFTYRFVAEPSGTMWYHCHVNVNEHVGLRGMWGPLIIVPKDPPAIEREVTKDYVMMFSSWVSKWADKPGQGGVPGDEPDYFTINAKAFPDTQPLRIQVGDVVRIRLIGAGDEVHSIHIHGRVFEIYAKDGHPLPAPIKADTILFGPGERYVLILRADDPGIWMVHDHIDRHTLNGTSPMGGIMTTIEYREADAKSRSFYHWKDKAFVPDFYYEESLKKPLGVYENAAFKGKPAP